MIHVGMDEHGNVILTCQRMCFVTTADGAKRLFKELEKLVKWLEKKEVKK